jgi:hypothetical protein
MTSKPASVHGGATPGKERFVRLWRLGDNYTEDAIKERILNQKVQKREPPLPEPNESSTV